MKIRITAISLLIFAFSGCATIESPQNDRSENVNKDCEITGIEESYLVCFGEATQKESKEEALETAKLSALINMAGHFAIKVWGTQTHFEIEKNGEYGYEFKSKENSSVNPINVKKHHIKDSATKQEGKEFSAWVLVEISKTEYKRIQIELDGFGVWAIKSDIPEAAARIRDIFPVFGKHGVNINEQTDYSLKTPKQVFAENKKAFYLRIEVSETKAEEYSGEFYSLVEINAELFNLLTGETVNRWTVEGKGAAYSAKEARENAVTKAVREIVDQI